MIRSWADTGWESLLVVLGAFLLAVFAYSVLRPTKLSSTQRFEGYGVKAEVSLQLVVLVLAVVLSASGLFVNVWSRHEAIKELRDERAAQGQEIRELRAQLAVARAPKTIDLSINAQLAGIDTQQLPDPEKLECQYNLAGDNNVRTAKVHQALSPLLYTISIPLLRVDSVIQNMSISHVETKRKWTATNIGPTSPLVGFALVR